MVKIGSFNYDVLKALSVLRFRESKKEFDLSGKNLKNFVNGFFNYEFINEGSIYDFLITPSACQVYTCN